MPRLILTHLLLNSRILTRLKLCQLCLCTTRVKLPSGHLFHLLKASPTNLKADMHHHMICPRISYNPGGVPLRQQSPRSLMLQHLHQEAVA